MNTKHNMKYLIAVGFHAAGIVSTVVLSLLATSTWADQSNQVPVAEVKAIKTKVIHGFCIGLAGWNSDFYTNNTSSDDSLIFLPWTTNKPAWIVVPTEPEYAYQVELFDTNGVAMPKTDLGKKAGTKFFDFDSTAYEKGITIKHLHAQKIGEVTDSPFLFRPSDLFKVEKPGNYTLRIRFQILAFPRTGPNHGDYTNDLIRFPPLDYPLVKSEAFSKKQNE
jgi:hypothetical protein